MRADLLALTPAMVTELSNAGLVKRALRELETGQGPRLEEDAGGVVKGTFPDGVIATLPPGKLLRDAPCSCGSVAVCRHRVAVALAYPSFAGGTASRESWSPATIDDAELARFLGERMVERARRLASSSPIVVTVTPGAVPEAALPTCNVRFLVPRDLAYARCDCTAGGACEHVALAVFAFREASSLDGPRTVELGGATALESAHDPLEEALDLARAVLRDGVAHAPASLAQRFARAKASLERARLLWPLEIVCELEDLLAAYRDRSARYRPALAAGLLVELAARARAAKAGGELPTAAILGAGEARETLLDQARLVSLGARVEGTDAERSVSVFLADSDSATVLVLEKSWTFSDDEKPLGGPELGRRSIATGVRLDQLARGQLVSRAVKRRANRTIALGSGTAARTTVLGQSGDWGALGALVVTSAPALDRELAARPPRIISPRVLADRVRVIAVKRVRDVVYAPGAQMLAAVIELSDDSTIRLERHHHGAAPYALDALATALGAAPRFVTGDVRRTSSGLVMDPLAVAGERVVVPDVEPAAADALLPLGTSSVARSTIEGALAIASAELEAVAHAGLSHGPSVNRVRESAAKLESVGLGEAAARMRSLADELRKVAESAPVEPSANAWFAASLRIALSVETISV